MQQTKVTNIYFESVVCGLLHDHQLTIFDVSLAEFAEVMQDLTQILIPPQSVKEFEWTAVKTFSSCSNAYDTKII